MFPQREYCFSPRVTASNFKLMRKNHNKRGIVMNNRILVAAFSASALFCLYGAARAEGAFQPLKAGSIVLDVRATNVSPDAGDPIKTAAGVNTGLKADVKDAWAPTIGLQYFFTDNVAAELIAGTTQHEITASGTEVRKTWVLPPVLTLQYHFAPKARFNPYIGAGINYMIFYSGKNYNGFTVKTKDGFGEALQAGFDYALGGKWTLNVDVKKVWMETDATVNGGALTSKVNLDPLVTSVGVGYRF